MTTLTQNIQVHRLLPKDYPPLCDLFVEIPEDEEARFFHPHPFTKAQAKEISEYSGADLYLGAWDKGALIGYGLLRGWDAQFTIPSLGIYLRPSARGKGYGKPFMQQLHAYAQQKKAPAVRLKLYPSNAKALGLYQSLGYIFSSEEEGQWVGMLDLNQAP